MLKLKAKVVTRRGAVATISRGRITVRKVCRPDAPSTYEASFRSPGIAVSAPEQTRKKYGKPIHRFTIRTENRARLASVSQCTLTPRNWLISPKSWFSIAFHTSVVRMPGSPNGTISSNR